MTQHFHSIGINGILYLLIGVASALISNPLEPGITQTLLRLGALAAGLIVLILHIRMEITRFHSSPRRAATKAASAVAFGTLLLAVYANVMSVVGASTFTGSLLLALLIWPLVTGVVSFPIALALAALYVRRSRKS